MNKTFLYLLAMLVLGLTSCEEVIDYELDTAETKLVVEGLITDQPGPYQVRLSNTKGYLDEGRTPGVNGALVIVSDNKGTVDTLEQISEGVYQTTKLQGQAGNTYFLRAVVSGKEYTAQSFMPAVTPIDSLTFVYKHSADEDDDGYHPYIHFRDPAGRGNYYRWNVFINGVLAPDELVVLNDDLYDGNYGHADMGFALKKGDKLKAELYAVDKPAYEFWTALVNQQNSSGGPFESTPANAPTNISNGAIGYFGASAVSAMEAEVKE
ncbi:uncharacterized protein DUF4249 [Pontibacter ummariensis]|uniref:DUF4249 domain-containing protein n=1 Tax=Pontibacter ummariensis TaxID=1610492 RepID=A0A239CI67_9BACT|nr:DUF4249 domain-containing protein [Pontibacter ummariensis]PRY15020.1 uncharacterized protein DUF4249 [Pontibacter ummariensis]SNS19381.1 protein of unknown function [Pontibacter ummariensis]